MKMQVTKRLLSLLLAVPFWRALQSPCALPVETMSPSPRWTTARFPPRFCRSLWKTRQRNRNMRIPT